MFYIIVLNRMSSAADDAPCELLPSVKFNVRVVRNLLEKPVDDTPLYDVVLNMKTVKVHMCCVCVLLCMLLCSVLCVLFCSVCCCVVCVCYCAVCVFM